VPGTPLVAQRHPGTGTDPETARTRGQTFGTVKRWAGVWYRQWYVLDEPGAEAVIGNACTRNYLDP